MTVEQDIDFVRSRLPGLYEIKESNSPGSIHCVSKTGIEENDLGKAMWEDFSSQLKKHFGPRFQEVDHNVCYNHTDFTIYLKQQQ